MPPKTAGSGGSIGSTGMSMPPQTVSRPSCASPSVTPEGIGALDGTGVLGAPHRSSLRWGPLGGEPLKRGGLGGGCRGRAGARPARSSAAGSGSSWRSPMGFSDRRSLTATPTTSPPPWPWPRPSSRSRSWRRRRDPVGRGAVPQRGEGGDRAGPGRGPALAEPAPAPHLIDAGRCLAGGDPPPGRGATRGGPPARPGVPEGHRLLVVALPASAPELRPVWSWWTRSSWIPGCARVGSLGLAPAATPASRRGGWGPGSRPRATGHLEVAGPQSWPVAWTRLGHAVGRAAGW